MAVAWYGVKVWKMTSPDGSQTIFGTKPTHSYTWEMWTVTKDDGTTVQVPQRFSQKYRGYRWSIAYATETDPPTVALFRIEYPDTEQPPLEAGDYMTLLNTQAKWNTAMAQYPSLRGRFADQPYFPAV